MFDAFVILIVIHHLARHCVRTLWLSMTRGGRIAYTLYLLFGPVLVFLLYNVIFDGDAKYPVPIAWGWKWLIVTALCVLVGFVYLVFMLSVRDLHVGCAECDCASCLPQRAILRTAPARPCAHSAACSVQQLGDGVTQPWGQSRWPSALARYGSSLEFG